MSGEGEEQKLYVKITCSICMGGKRNPGYSICPYCDMERKTFVEASPSVIRNYLSSSLDKKEKADLVKFLNDVLCNSNNF